MGKTVRFRMGTLTGLWGMLDSGSLDSIANPTAATKEREEKYLFTAPYDYDPTSSLRQKAENHFLMKEYSPFRAAQCVWRREPICPLCWTAGMKPMEIR